MQALHCTDGFAALNRLSNLVIEGRPVVERFDAEELDQ